MTSEKVPKPACMERSMIGDWGRERTCKRAGTIERDGKLYCCQHDPVARAERYESSFKKRIGRHKAEMARAEHNARIVNAHEQAVALAKAVNQAAMNAEFMDKMPTRTEWVRIIRMACEYLRAAGSENERA